jgi:hypothetical protein
MHSPASCSTACSQCSDPAPPPPPGVGHEHRRQHPAAGQRPRPTHVRHGVARRRLSHHRQPGRQPQHLGPGHWAAAALPARPHGQGQRLSHGLAWLQAGHRWRGQHREGVGCAGGALPAGAGGGGRSGAVGVRRGHVSRRRAGGGSLRRLQRARVGPGRAAAAAHAAGGGSTAACVLAVCACGAGHAGPCLCSAASAACLLLLAQPGNSHHVHAASRLSPARLLVMHCP